MTLEKRFLIINLTIADLEAEKQKIIDADKTAKVEKIIQITEQKGISIDEIIEMISEQKKPAKKSKIFPSKFFVDKAC